MNQNQQILIESENMSFLITETAEPRYAVFISKIFLKNFKQVDIHALGSAIDLAVFCAENLQRIGLATIKKIEIFDESKQPKIIISLRVTENGLQILNNGNYNMKFI